MKKALVVIAILVAGTHLAACTTNQIAPKNESMNAQTTDTSLASASTAIGGNIERSMDANDKEKLSRALDKSLGKSTEWINGSTNIAYTVTPTRKLAYNGNPYCRQYTLVSVANDIKNEINGTACVSSTDSTWRVISLNN